MSPHNTSSEQFFEALDEPLQASSGLWAFDPATLTQRRPAVDESVGYGDPMMTDGMSLNHERTHWFQFCGTTFGAAWMTLARVEDSAALNIFGSASNDPDTRAFAKHRIADRSVALLEDPARPVDESSSALSSILRSFVDARMAKSLLLDFVTAGDGEGRPYAEVLGHALMAVDKIYAMHTGGHRPWSPGTGADAYFQADSDVDHVRVGEREMTTRHLLESGAVLNELGLVLAPGWWGGISPEKGNSFSELPRNMQYVTSDRLENLSSRYGLCIEYPLEQWRSSFPGVLNGVRVVDLARAMPALACCFDIALNPQVGPLCEPVPLSWPDLYPPARFVTAVRAVSSVGLLDTWPDNSTYESYRRRVLDASNLSLGTIQQRSSQHPRFNSEFFSKATIKNPVVRRMSYFDYLIWAMESLHLFKRRHAFVAALPWLMMCNLEDFNGTEFMVSTDFAFAGAPLYWIGDVLGNHMAISEELAWRLALDLCMLHVMKHVLAKAGPVDLARSFPPGLLRDPRFQNVLVNSLANSTNLPDFRRLEVFFSTPDDDVLPIIGGETPSNEESPAPVLRGGAEHRLIVTRAEVEDGDLLRVLACVEQLQDDPYGNLRSLELEFAYYSNTPAGLWDIPEVRQYFRSFRRACPIWPWYIRTDLDPRKCLTFALMY